MHLRLLWVELQARKFDSDISKKVTHFKIDDDDKNSSTFTLKVENIEEFNKIKKNFKNKVKLISSEFIS